MHKDVGEPVTKSKRCLLNSRADTAASTSKATTSTAVLSEGAEATATETADNHVSVFTAFTSDPQQYVISQLVAQ